MSMEVPRTALQTRDRHNRIRELASPDAKHRSFLF
jgi:hypothetical protein